MDIKKLEALSNEQLMEIGEGVKAVLASRFDCRPVRGRIARFDDKNGNEVTCRIEGVNHKTVSVVTISPVAGAKWRVGHSHLRVDPVARTMLPKALSSMTAAVKPTSKPITSGGDAW